MMKNVSVEVQDKRVDSTYEPKAAVVGNIPEHMSSDPSLLGFIVEKISGISEEDYTMELMPESSVAVVTFSNSKGMYFINLLKY